MGRSFKQEEIRLKKWQYQITDREGIHARPAVMLVREAKKYRSRIVLGVEGQTTLASDLMEIMNLNVKRGQEVEISISGEDEELAYRGMTKFFQEYL